MSDQSETLSNQVIDVSADSPPGPIHKVEIPDNPVVIIKPGGTWRSINLNELWEYRELLFFLTWRDIKIRYKQTALGIAWAIIQPLLATLIFTLFFGKLAGVPSDNIPYPLFAFAGLLPWTFFSNAITNSGNSLVGSSHLITKVYFPRLVIPAASVLAGLADLAMAFSIFFVMMLWYGADLSMSLLMLPVLIFLTVLLAIGVGMVTSALNVKYRDVRFALPFLVQIWMFASPIIYPTSLVPEKWRLLLGLNPMVGIIEGYRAAFFNRPFDWQLLGISAVISIFIFIFAAFIFRRMEKEFADVV